MSVSLIRKLSADDGRLPWTTAAEMFADLTLAGGDKPVFRARQDGLWADSSWREVGDAAQAFGLEARARGLQRGDTVAVLAKTRPEWMVADMGAVGAGLICAGIYPTEPPQKIAYVLNDSRARLVLADTAEQVEKLQAIRASCPALEIIVVLDPEALPQGDPMFVGYASWIASGRARMATSPAAWRDMRDAISADDVAILIYTSGTTGPPKGAMITHGNIAYQVAHGPETFRMQEGWLRPAFLPLCHIAERMFTYFALAGGMVSVFVDGPAGLLADLPDLQPQFLLGVPRVYEKLQAAADDWIRAQPAELRALLREAVLHPSARPAAQSAEALGALRRAIGLERAEVLVSGGARFPGETGRWFRALGIPVRDLYGMTECGTVAVNFDDTATPGTVGLPCPHGEVRLAASGEILVRGPHVFRGYLNLPDKTADVLRDGWYHSGDVGRIDPDGRLVLLDRLKDIIISSSGKNITPSEVEGALKASPYIADAVAVGDGRNYLTALIILDQPATMEALALAKADETPVDLAALAAAPATIALIEDAVALANAKLSRPENVRAFRIIPREISASDDVLTPTLKIKRGAFAQRFADLIEDMYAPRPAASVE